MKCREFRKEFKYTLKDLAIATGYSISAISKWERENDTMPKDFVEKIYKAYGVVIERQFRNFVFNVKHQGVVNEFQEELRLLHNDLLELQEENIKLKKKLERISKICQEE